MSRRTSRRRQQAMNQWRRTGRDLLRASLGIPVRLAPGAWYYPPDPRIEREEFVRQIMARVTLSPGQSVMPAEVGRFDGVRIIAEGAADQLLRQIPPSARRSSVRLLEQGGMSRAWMDEDGTYHVEVVDPYPPATPPR